MKIHNEQRLGAQEKVSIPANAKIGDIIPFFIIPYKKSYFAEVASKGGTQAFCGGWVASPVTGSEVGGAFTCYDSRTQKCCESCESGGVNHLIYAICCEQKV